MEIFNYKSESINYNKFVKEFNDDINFRFFFKDFLNIKKP